MVFGINLPDWKTVLNETLSNYVKTPLEQSTANLTNLAEKKTMDLQTDLNKKFAEFKENNQKFQRTLIVITFATFLVITISLTLSNKDNINHD
ncbi:MAG: hypothetical protein mread185_000389 [Mycoplasmataceae bacterium]|nr:MAG: hypothetical protein mread185_000389 [Mycoplasmataceae bacterium]